MTLYGYSLLASFVTVVATMTGIMIVQPETIPEWLAIPTLLIAAWAPLSMTVVAFLPR